MSSDLRGSGVRRSATLGALSSSGRRRNKDRDQQQGNVSWGASKPIHPTTKKNMFLDGPLMMGTDLKASASTPVLKSCLSVGSQGDSLDRSLTSKKEQNTVKRNVSFTNIEIREHPITVGVNPSVSRGPPISLDWYDEKTCGPSQVLPLDDYEQSRPYRRRKEEIVLSRPLRESLLKDLGGATNKDLIKATVEANRVKKERLQTATEYQRRGLAAEQQQLAIENARKKLSRLMGTKKSSKQEQEELWKQAAEYAKVQQPYGQGTSLSTIPERSKTMPVLSRHNSATPREDATKNAAWD